MDELVSVVANQAAEIATLRKEVEGLKMQIHELKKRYEGESYQKVDVSGGQITLSQQEVKAKSEGLLIAAGEGRVQDIHRLLKEGAHISYADFFKDTALHYAARNGHLGAVAALISAGATLDAINHKRSTPLLEAARRGHRDVLCTLIKAGARVDVRDKYRLTRLHEATRQGHSECLEILKST